ncbi:unnamed protein product, partial [Discosporangium mesarthrocarpum]
MVAEPNHTVRFIEGKEPSGKAAREEKLEVGRGAYRVPEADWDDRSQTTVVHVSPPPSPTHTGISGGGEAMNVSPSGEAGDSLPDPGVSTGGGALTEGGGGQGAGAGKGDGRSVVTTRVGRGRKLCKDCGAVVKSALKRCSSCGKTFSFATTQAVAAMALASASTHGGGGGNHSA